MKNGQCFAAHIATKAFIRRADVVPSWWASPQCRIVKTSHNCRPTQLGFDQHADLASTKAAMAMHDAQMSTWAAMARRDRNFDRIRPTYGKGWRPFLSVGPKIVKKLARCQTIRVPIRDFPEISEILAYPGLRAYPACVGPPIRAPIRCLSGPIRDYPGFSGNSWSGEFSKKLPMPTMAYPAQARPLWSVWPQDSPCLSGGCGARKSRARAPPQTKALVPWMCG